MCAHDGVMTDTLTTDQANMVFWKMNLGFPINFINIYAHTQSSQHVSQFKHLTGTYHILWYMKINFKKFSIMSQFLGHISKFFRSLTSSNISSSKTRWCAAMLLVLLPPAEKSFLFLIHILIEANMFSLVYWKSATPSSPCCLWISCYFSFILFHAAPYWPRCFWYHISFSECTSTTIQ